MELSFLLSRWLLPDRSSAIEQMGDPKEYTIEMEVGPVQRAGGENPGAGRLYLGK